MIKLQWLILLCELLIASSTGKSTSLPTKAFQKECIMKFKDNGVCACSDRGKLAPVRCHPEGHRIEIQPCYCIFYDSDKNMTIIGKCFFSCTQFFTTYIGIGSSTAFNDYICNKYGSLNRMGRFCGHCNDSYGLAAYSYQVISCIPCQSYGYRSWLKYFIIALLPLTIFYVFAVLLGLNVTSSSFNGMLMVIQCTTSPVLMIFYQQNVSSRTYTIFHGFALTLLCMANLDFFRLLYPPNCIHPKANIIQILSLDYIVALYPFLLIFLTYVLITAYDRENRLLVWMWKPFRKCTHHYRKTWNIRTSLIEIFASFILLSSVRVLGVSIQILSFTGSYDVYGQKSDYYYSLYDGSIQYFGSQHLPFALLGIAVSLILVILPLILLAIYPCRCFHRCLNSCRLNSQTLHVFMDAFQGSYRTKPRDMRYFSSYYLLLRVLILIQVQVFQSKLMLYTSGILSLISAAIVALFQPYKVKAHNKIDTIAMMLMGVYFISFHESLLLLKLQQGQEWAVPSAFQESSIWILTLMLIFLILHKPFRWAVQAVIKKIKARWNHGDYNNEAIDSFDRDHGVDNYPPLLG